MVGSAMVKHWAKPQPTIALSSGEAELGGIGTGMAQAIGLQSLAADMKWKLQRRVRSAIFQPRLELLGPTGLALAQLPKKHQLSKLGQRLR